MLFKWKLNLSHFDTDWVRQMKERESGLTSTFEDTYRLYLSSQKAIHHFKNVSSSLSSINFYKNEVCILKGWDIFIPNVKYMFSVNREKLEESKMKVFSYP